MLITKMRVMPDATLTRPEKPGARPVGYNYQVELAQRLGSLHMLNMEALTSGEKRRPYMLAEGVAIINISGVLTNEAWWWDETEYGTIKSEIQQALQDDEAKGILLRVNSPGGSTDGAFETAAFLVEAAKKKPMWAVADMMAYSAGYLLASQASRIYVSPTTGGVGSIGVYALHLDMSGMLDQMGIKPTFVSAGEGKTEGNRFEPLGKDAKARLKTEIDRLYGEFIGYVSRARKMPEDECRALGAYCYHGAKAAIGAGLADASGSLEDAWLALASTPDDDEPGKPKDPMMERFSARKAEAAQAPAKDQDRHSEEEVEMSTENKAGAGGGTVAKQYTQAEVDAMVAEASAKARGEGTAAATTEAKQITALCGLAGKSDLAASFITKGTPVVDVQAELQRIRAEADKEEIDSHAKHPADKPQPGQLTGGMIIAAAEKIAKQMGGGR